VRSGIFVCKNLACEFLYQLQFHASFDRLSSMAIFSEIPGILSEAWMRSIQNTAEDLYRSHPNGKKNATVDHFSFENKIPESHPKNKVIPKHKKQKLLAKIRWSFESLF